MATYRLVNTKFWDDAFIEELDAIEKLVFIYLLTNPSTTIAGVYQMTVRKMAFQTGVDRDSIERIIKRFEDAERLTFRDGWVVLHNFLKYQSINPKVSLGIERVLNDCPDWVRETVLKSMDSLPIGYAEPMHRLRDTLTLTINSNYKPLLSEEGGKKRATRFPKKFDVTDDMRSWAKKKYPRIPIDSETEKFADYHQAKGSTFKDWAAAWRSWMRKAAEFKPDYKATERESYKNECPY